MDSALRVGVGRATITPPVGVDLMGYSRRSQPSTGIHMDMYATALVASADDATLAILDCDLIYLHPPLVDEIRDAIAATKDLVVSTGVIKFHQMGEVIKAVQVQVVKDGNFHHFATINDPVLLAPPDK